MRRFATALALAALLAAGGCDEKKRLQQSSGSTTPRYERATTDTSPVAKLAVPVRIGETGSNFAACNSQGTGRRPGAALAVRAAPFDASKQILELPSESSFFVCSRSLDQQWLGIVFDAAGTAAAECGVAGPVPVGRDYAGPCRSGWVASDGVKLTAD